jgi:D-sedoheptulose 7-phosphate isomerase
MKNETAQYAAEYLQNLSKLMIELDFDVIDDIAQAFESARLHSKTVFFIGNGGSAATASHFANDLATAIPLPEGAPRYKSISLADSNAAITCLANDTGYENIFVGQLKNLLEPGDVLVAISASGNSPNLVKAVEFANSHGALTIGFTGFDGGKLRQLSRVCLHVQTPKGAYGPVEDIHMSMDHLITGYLRQCAMKPSKK